LKEIAQNIESSASQMGKAENAYRAGNYYLIIDAAKIDIKAEKKKLDALLKLIPQKS
jgi:hypothetical protein